MLNKLGLLLLFINFLSFQTKRTPFESPLILAQAKVSVGKEQNTLPFYIYILDGACSRTGNKNVQIVEFNYLFVVNC